MRILEVIFTQTFTIRTAELRQDYLRGVRIGLFYA